MNDQLFYDLHVVNEPVVMTQVQSSRGTVSWQHRVTLDRVAHEEPLPAGFDRTQPAAVHDLKERLAQFLRGAAWERFLDYLERVAVATGLEWLALNLEGGEYAFLFSTRTHAQLAEKLGYEAGTLETMAHQFYVRTDRRIPSDVCYCLRTKNHQMFSRYEFGLNNVRVYLSDVIRIGGGQSIVQMNADDAIRYLRTVRRGASTELLINDTQLPTSTVTVTGSAPTNASLEGGRPSLPADALRAFRVELTEEETVVEPVSPKTQPRLPQTCPDECPKCQSEVFQLSDDEGFCLSCEWNNLTTLRDEEA